MPQDRTQASAKSQDLFDPEEWRDVLNFPGYQVSTHGGLRSRRTGRWGLSEDWHPLKPSKHTRGYLVANLYQNGALHKPFVHRLVLEAFAGPCPEGMEARHVNDNDRTNNHIDNLVWGTPAENQADRIRHGTDSRGSKAPHAKLTEALVLSILSRAAAGERTATLAREHGVRRETIWKILCGTTWKNVPRLQRAAEVAAKLG